MSNLTRNFAATIFTGVLVFSGLYAINVNAASAYTQVPQVVVHYGDLNLTTAVGVQKLYRRLQSASQQVCHNLEGINLAMRAQYQTCYNEALSSAIAKVNLETLTALYRKSASKDSLS